MLGLVRLASFALAAACFTTVALSACDQGEGQRCQRNSDCQDGLVCPALTSVCQRSNIGNDAVISPDANIDGGPTDDATVDATVDAIPADATDDATVDSMVVVAP